MDRRKFLRNGTLTTLGAAVLSPFGTTKASNTKSIWKKKKSQEHHHFGQ